MKKINIDKPRGLEYNNKYKKLVGPKGFRLRENPSWEPATREFDSPRLHHCFLKKEEGKCLVKRMLKVEKPN